MEVENDSFYADRANGAVSSNLPKSMLRKLEALRHPDIGSASLDGDAFCKLVLWLEEEKIRLYEPNQRNGLRDFGACWWTHVTNYAKTLGITVESYSDSDSGGKLRLLNWLINAAVHDVFRDGIEEKNLSLVFPSGAVSGFADGEQQLQDLVPELNNMLDKYKLPKLQSNAIDTDTIAALQCIKTRVCQKNKGTVDLDINQLPVAVESNEPTVRNAAVVLRLLHTIEMTQLQANLSSILDDIQRITANPKTDSSLGRVGT